MRRVIETFFRAIMAATGASIATTIAGIILILLLAGVHIIGVLQLFLMLVLFGFVFGTPVALAHILLLGLPAWLLFDRWRPIGQTGAAAMGAVIGATPATIFAGFNGLEIATGTMLAIPIAEAGDVAGIFKVAALFGAGGAAGALAFRARLSAAE